ncbi:DedA family protein [Halorhodospira neutriphila]
MPEYAVAAVEWLGVVGVFLAMLVVAPELLMPFLGYAAYQSGEGPLPALIAGSLGGTTGSTLIYAAARLVDGERVRRWIVHGGRWQLLREHDLEAIDALFQRHGGALVLFGRFIPTVRSLVSVPAGLLPMPWGRFLLFTLLGTTAWNAVLMGGGYTMGANWEALTEALGTYGAIATAVTIAAALIFTLRRLRGATLGKR